MTCDNHKCAIEIVGEYYSDTYYMGPTKIYNCYCSWSCIMYAQFRRDPNQSKAFEWHIKIKKAIEPWLDSNERAIVFGNETNVLQNADARSDQAGQETLNNQNETSGSNRRRKHTFYQWEEPARRNNYKRTKTVPTSTDGSDRRKRRVPKQGRTVKIFGRTVPDV